MTHRRFNMETHIIESFTSNAPEYPKDEMIKAVVREAEKRGIPVSIDNNNHLIRFGYGRNQKWISAKILKRTVSTASSILDKIFSNGLPVTIPIVAITGTNGKTTTARMISRILSSQGHIVGTTTTHGIFIGGECIETGDTTGPRSAAVVLNHHKVSAAVLETARGGIIRSGIAYGKADVGVFTNLSEDHLGTSGVNTLEELLRVKSIVIRAVKDNGTSVLNADDLWIMKAMNEAKGKILLFSMDKENPWLSEHVKRGGGAVYVKDNGIFYEYAGNALKLMNIDEIPATMNGALKHNIQNGMAAIGASLALKVSPDIIKDTLSGFSCSPEDNPGRFNVYDMGGFKVILDYGHNIEGYKVTIEGIKSMNPGRTVGIIGVPGDRKNEDVLRIGKISGSFFDIVIIKEDYDLRGRKPLEVAEILKEGAILGGMNPEFITIIPKEDAALEFAMQKAQKGDLIAIFFEKLEPLVELVLKYQNAQKKEQLAKKPVPV
jgi:cyanophycin synthetase